MLPKPIAISIRIHVEFSTIYIATKSAEMRVQTVEGTHRIRA